MSTLEEVQRKWIAMEPSERKALIIMIVVLCIFLLIELVIVPGWRWQQKVEQQWRRSLSLEGYFTDHQVELAQASQWEVATHQPVAQIVQSALAQTGLSAPATMMQNGQQLQTEFKAVPFNALVSWLAQMEQHGVHIINLDMAAIKDQPGLVNASVTLAGRG